jgi:hypothetical protein
MARSAQKKAAPSSATSSSIAEAACALSKGCRVIRYRLSFWRGSPCTATGKAGAWVAGCSSMPWAARSDIAGARALAVHAKDDSAASFYRHFGFIPSVTDSRHLFKLIKDIRITAGLDQAEGKPS